MEHVGKQVQRRVYIATDEPSVFTEAETSYVLLYKYMWYYTQAELNFYLLY